MRSIILPLLLFPAILVAGEKTCAVCETRITVPDPPKAPENGLFWTAPSNWGYVALPDICCPTDPPEAASVKFNLKEELLCPSCAKAYGEPLVKALQRQWDMAWENARDAMSATRIKNRAANSLRQEQALKHQIDSLQVLLREIK